MVVDYSKVQFSFVSSPTPFYLDSNFVNWLFEWLETQKFHLQI